MSISVLYLPPHLLRSLSFDPLLSSCGVICSAGSRRLDSELRGPTHVPAGFIHYSDRRLLFSPVAFSYFLLHLQHTLCSFHLISCVCSVCLDKPRRLLSQVASEKINLKVISDIWINTVGHEYIFSFQYKTITHGFRSICVALSSTAGS